MECITLTPYDYVKAIGDDLIQVSHNRTLSSTYNLRYVKLKPYNNTQRSVIDRILQSNPSVILDNELKALITIDLLIKKLGTYDNVVTKFLELTRYSEDKTQIELKKRAIRKHRVTLNKYLDALKPDSNFTIERHDKNIHIYYKGQYANTKRHIYSEHFKLNGC